MERLEHRVMSSCAFRLLVLRAHEARKHGKRLVFSAYPEATDPEIELATGPGDRLLPGPMLQCDIPGAWWFGIPVAMPRNAVRHALLGERFAMGICLHADWALDVTLLCIPTNTKRAEVADRAVETLLEAVARCSVWELVDHVNARAPDVPVFPN